MSNLRRIFYVSRSDPHINGAVVKDILFKAQRFNRQLDITGVLAQSSRHFAQVLEGTAENLAVLTSKIGRDPRHAQVTVLFDEPISKRDYAEWTMGFVYDPTLSDSIETALLESAKQSGEQDKALAHALFLHVSDLANP